MKKLLYILAGFAFFVPVAAYAAPTSWNYAGGILEPLQSMWTALVRADHFQATSTTASVFPYASTTALSVSSLTSGNCVQASTGGLLTTSSNPCGTGTGSGLATTSPWTTGQVAYVVSDGSVSSAATSTLTASSPLTGSFTHVGSTGSLGIQVANTSQSGYLTSTDWNTFNNKLSSAITAIGPLGQTQTGSTITIATSTSSFNGLTVGTTVVGSGNTLTWTPSISGTLGVAGGGTGTTTWQSGSIPFYNGSTLTENNTGLYWDATNARLGLGTVAPGAALEIMSTGQSFKATRAAGSGSAAAFSFIKESGTIAAPITVADGDEIAALNFIGYDGTSSGNVTARIEGYVDGPVSTGVIPIRLGFITGSTTANRAERLSIAPGGNIGIGTTTPGSILSIQNVANFVASGISTIFNSLKILGSLYLPALGTPAGSFLAVDPNGQVIATSTPSGGGGTTVTPYYATSTSDVIQAIPVSSGDVVQIWVTGRTTVCANAGGAGTFYLYQSSFGNNASTTIANIGNHYNAGTFPSTQCSVNYSYEQTATTTETWYLEFINTSNLSLVSVMAQKFH